MSLQNNDKEIIKQLITEYHSNIFVNKQIMQKQRKLRTLATELRSKSLLLKRDFIFSMIFSF